MSANYLKAFRFFRVFSLIFIMTILFCAVLYSKDKIEEKNPLLAVIGEEKIYLSNFNEWVELLKIEENEKLSDDGKIIILKKIIESKLEEKEFLKTDKMNDPLYISRVEDYEKAIIVRNYIKDVLVSGIKVPEEEIKAYYEQHPHDFIFREGLRFSHIRVDTEEEAKKLLDHLLKNPQDFEEYAQKYSKCVSNVRMGDIGYYEKNKMPQYTTVCYSLEIDKIYDKPVKSQAGFHIVKKTDHQGKEAPTYEDVKEKIKELLLNEKQNKAFNEKLDLIAKEYEMKIDEEKLALDFEDSKVLEKNGKDFVVSYKNGGVTGNIVNKAIALMTPDQKKEFKSNIDTKRIILTRLAKSDLLNLKARDDEFHKREDIKKVLDFSKQKVIYEFSDEELRKRLVPDDKMIEDYYKNHLDEFNAPAQIKARHILVKEEDKAKEMYEMLKKDPKSFEKLAFENSICPSKQQGGDLGFFGKNTMVKPFEDVAFSLKKDEISKPVQTQFGYHIIQLTDVKDAGVWPLEQASEGIKQKLFAQLYQKERIERSKELFEKYNVKIAETIEGIKE